MGMMALLILAAGTPGASSLVLTPRQACETMRQAARSQVGQTIGPAAVTSAAADCVTRIITITYKIAPVPDEQVYTAAFFDGARKLCANDSVAMIGQYGYRFRYVLGFEGGRKVEQTIFCDRP